jgi:hypothetical protein
VVGCGIEPLPEGSRPAAKDARHNTKPISTNKMRSGIVREKDVIKTIYKGGMKNRGEVCVCFKHKITKKTPRKFLTILSDIGLNDLFNIIITS